MAAFVCAAAGPCAGTKHLRLRSQFGIGAGCCKRRMFIYAQSKFEFLHPHHYPLFDYRVIPVVAEFIVK